MQIRIEIVPPLTEAFGHRETERFVIEKRMTSATLAELLNALIKEYPNFSGYALEGSSPVCPNLLVVLNGEIVPVRKKLHMILHDGDVLQILPGFFGG